MSMIFELKADLRYPGMTFASEGDFIFPAEGRVKRMQEIAPSFEVMVSDEETNPHSVRFPDFVDFTPGFCCFSATAWSVIESGLAMRGDIVTLIYAQEGRGLEFVLFEPIRWFDCVDFKRSHVQYFDVPPYRVKWVDNLVLKNVSDVDEDIFRVDHLPTRLFCTAKCAQFVKKHKLTGFDFRRVPTSE